MLLAHFATTLLALLAHASGPDNSSATLPDLEPVDLPLPRTLIYKEVCYRNVFDDADGVLDTTQTRKKDSNGHPIFYLTGSKQDLDPIANPADYEADSTEDEEGDEVGFEEFCYRMRRSAESAETGKGAGTTSTSSK